MKTNRLLLVLIACTAGTTSWAAPPLAPDPLSEAERTLLVGPKAKSAVVLRAQVLLDRAHFSSGEIDASYGANLRRAIEGYQKAGGLEVTGMVDAPTWARLNADTAPILTAYTILDTDVAGPFDPIPAKMADKAGMAALGYESVAEALGEKLHISPKLLKQLNPGKNLGLAGEVIVAPNIEAAGDLPKAAKLIIDKSDSTLTMIDAGGKTVGQFPASTGSKHDPLPLGDWKVKGVGHNPVFRYNPELFWDADPGNAKATIAAGPNNPVGVVWIDLTKEHYGIHGTPEPSRIGKTQSHGCIRLTNWDAAALAKAVGPGVDVLMQE